MLRSFSADAELGKRGAVRGIRRLTLYERMARELVAYRLAYGTRTTPVDDAYVGKARERRGVDERANGLSRLLCGAAAKVELVASVDIGGRTDRDWGFRRQTREGARVTVGVQSFDWNADALPADAEDDRLVRGDLGDDAADAERWRHHWVARREWTGGREWLVESRQRLTGARRTLGRGSEPAVALPFSPA